MKKHFINLTGIFLVLLLASCAADQLEVNETNPVNVESVWNYSGDNPTLVKVIAELKDSENKKTLERRLAKNEVLWKDAKFLLIDNKKRIMIPFLSTDKQNVIGVLSLIKNEKGKTTFDMIVRTRLNSPNNKLPFWNSDIWMGYFMASDKDILNIKNGNPGFRQSIATNKKLKAKAEYMCDLYEIITSHCSYAYTISSATGEAYNFVDNGCTDTYSYSSECYWVPDPFQPVIDPNQDSSGSGSGTGDNSNNLLQIINLLTNKTLCVYNMLENSNTGFNNLINKFDGKFPVAHLQLENSTTLPSNINAYTYKPDNYLIRIAINTNNLSRPNLSIARTIIHEVIHAEMYRKILSILNNGGNIDGLTTTQWEQKLSNGDYPGIFDYYSRYGVDGMDHELMAAHYRTIISSYLKELQPGLSQNIYDSLAWEGLKNTTVWNALSSTQKTTISNTISNFNSIGSENCN